MSVGITYAVSLIPISHPRPAITKVVLVRAITALIRGNEFLSSREGNTLFSLIYRGEGRIGWLRDVDSGAVEVPARFDSGPRVVVGKSRKGLHNRDRTRCALRCRGPAALGHTLGLNKIG